MRRTAKMIASMTAAVLSVGAAGITAQAHGGRLNAPTPTEKDSTVLYWATQIADTTVDWSKTPSPVAVAGDEIVFTSGSELRALDKESGELLEKTGKLAASTSWSTLEPLYADGKIFVALDGGVVQAFDAESFESLWVYHDTLGGQAVSDLSYADGYVYTGFYASGESDFAAISTEDKDISKSDEEQSAAWTYTCPQGYYGMTALVKDGYVLANSDSGENGSEIAVFDIAASVESGEAVLSSKEEGIEGDLRSGTAFDEVTGYYFLSSKAGELIRFKLDDKGVISDLSKLDIGGTAASTPVSANGRVYVGVSGENSFGEYTGHKIVVVDAEKFEIAYSVETNYYCQSSAIMSKDGENYAYFFANGYPGKLYVVKDKPGQTEASGTTQKELEDGTKITECESIFEPQGAHQQYCLTNIAADENGTLYFKNDSGYIFAVGSKAVSLEIEGIEQAYRQGEEPTAEDVKVTAVFANGIKKDVTSASTTEVTDTAVSVSYKAQDVYGESEALFAEQSFEVYLAGDTNGDKVFDVKDVIRLQKYLNEKCDANEYALDPNGDGVTDIKDAIRMQKALNGEETELF